MPLARIVEGPELAEAAGVLRAGGRVVIRSAIGSSASLVGAMLVRSVDRPALLVTAHVDDAEQSAAELEWLLAGSVEVIRFPALEASPGESHANLEQLADRCFAARRIARLGARGAAVVVAPVHALMQPLPDGPALDALVRDVRKGATLAPGELLDWLDRAGYRRVDAIAEPGEVALRGGIMDILPAGSRPPVRLEYFGDEIERISEIDLDSMGSDRALDTAQLVIADTERVEQLIGMGGASGLHTRLGAGWMTLLHEIGEIAEQGKGYYERVFDGSRGILEPRSLLADLHRRAGGVAEINAYSRLAGAGKPRGGEAVIDLPCEMLPHSEKEARASVEKLLAIDPEARVVVVCRKGADAGRLRAIADEIPGAGTARIETTIGELGSGFLWRGGGGAVVVASLDELLGRYVARRPEGRIRGAKATDAFVELRVGDYVVHTDHGIARLTGLAMIKPRRAVNLPGAGAPEPEEHLTLEFAGRSKLHVPLTRIDLVQKYVGASRGKPTLSTLGGARWEGQKQRVTESVRELAAELLRVRAAREAIPGTAFPGDTAWQQEFEAAFPHTETEDQLDTISAVKRDMQTPRPMDRLVCGDVGFGKTEIAIRAAFKCAEAGRQVAVLAPTTVLVEQHERTFLQRFAGYPFKVVGLSRFRTSGQAREILDAVRKGHADVVIGTHRLLSPDVRFADLGLVVIDEEQRFGVEHKERLLRLRMTVDVLTLSATPIPRTLHMSMLGLRDISSLTTPPVDRRAVVTEVTPWSESVIAKGIARELSRGGQIFFVHNRVQSIQIAADRVRALAPGARVIVGHGQMPPGDLEEVMLKFMRREADILVCTTIIESGIDIPSANTMFIADAQRFGLAELHQLRGRVGRSSRRAYCTLLLPEGGSVSEVARRRLRAIEEFSMLGAGFKIAMRDLEIRGAGNLLGAEQSGHIAAVGYDMYCRLLEGASRELKREPEPIRASMTTIDIGVGGAIPKGYIPSDVRRLDAHRRIATAGDTSELARVEADLLSAYGEPPGATRRLLELAHIRVSAAALGIKAINLREKDLVLEGIEDTEMAKVVASRFDGAPGTVRVVGMATVYYRPAPSVLEAPTLLGLLRRRLGDVDASSARRGRVEPSGSGIVQ